MRRYALYIDHARRSAPIEYLIEVANAARAREMAERMLAESEEHLGVEVCEDGERLFGLGSFAERSWCGHRARSRRALRIGLPFRPPFWAPVARLAGVADGRRAQGGGARSS